MENDQPRGFAARVAVHSKFGVGEGIEGVSGTSAKADRAVMQAQNPHVVRARHKCPDRNNKRSGIANLFELST